ncbi:MAG: SRPBCC family protein [Bacteroidia bacterium]
MKIFTLKREIIVPVSISEAWLFFSDPRNLKKITPPEMDFTILTENLPDKVYSGLVIEYSVSPLLGIKTKWVSEIKKVNEPTFFIDEQRKGPYSFWMHKHSFEETAGGTLIKDEVQYALPFSLFGIAAHTIFVKRKLNKIFNYRTKIIEKTFSNDTIESALFI